MKWFFPSWITNDLLGSFHFCCMFTFISYFCIWCLNLIQLFIFLLSEGEEEERESKGERERKKTKKRRAEVREIKTMTFSTSTFSTELAHCQSLQQTGQSDLMQGAAGAQESFWSPAGALRAQDCSHYLLSPRMHDIKKWSEVEEERLDLAFPIKHASVPNAVLTSVPNAWPWDF